MRATELRKRGRKDREEGGKTVEENRRDDTEDCCEFIDPHITPVTSHHITTLHHNTPVMCE